MENFILSLEFHSLYLALRPEIRINAVSFPCSTPQREHRAAALGLCFQPFLFTTLWLLTVSVTSAGDSSWPLILFSTFSL